MPRRKASAKRRLADEYDAAQERGEVATVGNPAIVPDGNNRPTAADLGISRKAIHEAREIRNAEVAQPGIVKATVDAAIAAGEEPTRVAHVGNIAPVAVIARPGRGRAAICPRVREAIYILSGLPPANEVIAYLSGTDEAVLVAEQLPSAARWLAEFNELWPEEQADITEAA